MITILGSNNYFRNNVHVPHWCVSLHVEPPQDGGHDHHLLHECKLLANTIPWPSRERNIGIRMVFTSFIPQEPVRVKPLWIREVFFVPVQHGNVEIDISIGRDGEALYLHVLRCDPGKSGHASV